jgi:L-ascorbate metabolism protein UlaG (beta-lactamase superfamily)
MTYTTPEPHLTYVGHATVLIEMDGIRLMTDPILRNRVGGILRQSRPVHPAWRHDLDAVLISHLHLDHLDRPSLRKLDRGVRLIAPAGTADLLWGEGFQNIEEIRIADSTNVGPVKITATYAHHPGGRYPLGPAADCVGYLVSGSSSVYFAGDTDIFPEMADVEADLDCALLPVWGWGPTIRGDHMSPRTAAEALALLRPKMAVPIHWGTFAPIGMGWIQPRFLSEPPHQFKGHADDVAPEVDVRIVRPGNSVRFGR